jgi:hypothetical protein
MEEITLTKYRDKYGNVHNTKEKCERADAIWRDENEYNVSEEVKRLQLRCRRDRKLTERQEEQRAQRNRSTFPRVLIHKDKHSDIYFVATDFEGVVAGLWEWFTLQCDDQYGYYNYHPKTNDISTEILKLKDKDAAYAFVMERSEDRLDYETLEWFPVKVYNKEKN